jgi:hypothetical protein
MEKNLIIQTQYKYFIESHAPTSVFSHFGYAPPTLSRNSQEYSHRLLNQAINTLIGLVDEGIS